jgi:hypothetical protein
MMTLNNNFININKVIVKIHKITNKEKNNGEYNLSILINFDIMIIIQNLK